MTFSVDEWRAAFERMPPRESQLVQRLALDSQTDESLQALYGIDPAALQIAILRALRSLQATLVHQQPSLLPDAAERDEAATLASARAGAAAQHPLASLVVELQSQAITIKAALKQARVAEENSPERRRDERIRTALLWGLLVVSAYLYWQHEAPGSSLVDFARSLPARLFNGKTGP